MDTLDLHCSILGLWPDPSLDFSNSALLVCPGLQDWRLSSSDWRSYFKGSLLIAGTSNDPMYTKQQVRYLTNWEGPLLFQGYAENTPGQMRWAVDELKDIEDIDQVILTTAAYHLPRCALTFAAEWRRNGRQGQKFRFGCVPVIAGRSGPEFLKGFTSDVEFAGKETRGSSQSVASEIARIEAYQKKGDVATAEEFAEFLDMIS